MTVHYVIANVSEIANTVMMKHVLLFAVDSDKVKSDLLSKHMTMFLSFSYA